MAATSPLSDSITNADMLKKALSLFKHLKKSRSNENIEPTFHNFSFMCEKVVVTSSRPNTATKYNFYRAFYDNVCKTTSHYSVTTGVDNVKETGEVSKIKFNLYSKQNFKQYDDYIQLRSKNTLNGLKDTLWIIGMNFTEFLQEFRQDKNLHLEHLEDNVLNRGVSMLESQSTFYNR